MSLARTCSMQKINRSNLPAETLVPESNSAQSLSSGLQHAWLCLCHTQHAHISNRSKDPAQTNVVQRYNKRMLGCHIYGMLRAF